MHIQYLKVNSKKLTKTFILNKKVEIKDFQVTVSTKFQ